MPKVTEAFFSRAEADNDRFLDMMECYFSQPWETKLKDTRPQLHYQVPLPEKCTILSNNSSEGLVAVTMTTVIKSESCVLMRHLSRHAGVENSLRMSLTCCHF